MPKIHEVVKRALEPFYGRKKIIFWAKVYATGPFSCRMSTNKGIRSITVIDVCWDQVGDPILQFMDVESYYKINHQVELKNKLKSFLVEIAQESETYEGLMRLNERGII